MRPILGKETVQRREKGGGGERETENRFTKSSSANSPPRGTIVSVPQKNADSPRQELIPLRIQSGLLEHARANRTTLLFIANVNFKDPRSICKFTQRHSLLSYKLL